MSNRVSTHWEELHPAIRCAFDGCFDHLGYDISVISKEDQDRLFTATLDALPQGEEAAKKAAAALLVEMATDEGWADCLDTYEHNAEFARFLEIEPRLRGLLHEIACIVPDGECFCANLGWLSWSDGMRRKRNCERRSLTTWRRIGCTRECLSVATVTACEGEYEKTGAVKEG
jgi:hypothetical protein